MNNNKKGQSAEDEEDPSFANDNDMLLKIVEMRARASDTPTSTEAMESQGGNVAEAPVGLGGNLKMDDGDDDAPGNTAGLADSGMPDIGVGIHVDDIVDTRTWKQAPTLAVTPYLAVGSAAPGAHAVYNNSGSVNTRSTHESHEENLVNETSMEEENISGEPVANSAAPLNARLVDSTTSAMTARVRRIPEQQPSASDLEQATIQGVKAPPEEDTPSRTLQWLALACIFLMVVIIIVLSLGFTGVLNDDGEDNHNSAVINDTPPAATTSLLDNSTAVEPLGDLISNMTTLERIQATGVLRCSDVYFPNGFMYHDKQTGEKTGFYGELVSPNKAHAMWIL